MKGIFRKNRMAVLALTILSAMLFAGCTDAMPEMTDAQQKEISEFAAVTLLKYDANNRSRLVDRRFIKELNPIIEEEPEEEPKEKTADIPDAESAPSGELTIVDNDKEFEGPIYSGIADFLGLPAGVTITFTRMEIRDSYMPDGMDSSLFALDAAEGKKLVVLNFLLSNQSGNEQEINILGKNPIFRAIFNESETKNALTTLLDSDMSTYKENLATGTSENVVLLMEVESGMAERIESVKLLIRYNEMSYTFSLF